MKKVHQPFICLSGGAMKPTFACASPLVRQSLDVYVPDFTSFSEMFRFLMDLGKQMQYKKSGQMIFSDRLIYKYC